MKGDRERGAPAAATRLAEDVLLLLVDENSGGLMPVPRWALAYALSGAVLMDLSELGRVDTDAQHLMLIDAEPTGDEVLDTVLGEIAAADEVRSTRHWLDRFAERGARIREASLDALAERGILAGRDRGFVEFAHRAPAGSGPGRDPAGHGAPADGGGDDGGAARALRVRLRIIKCLTAEDIPDPRDVMTVCLVDACRMLPSLLNPSELDAVQSRLALLRRMDHIGRAVSEAIWEVEPPAYKPRARSTAPIPVARGLPFVGSAFAMARDMTGFAVRQYRELGPVFRIRAPGRRWIVIAGARANRFVNRHGKDHLRSGEVWRGFAHELGAARLVLSMDGPEHFRLRRAMRDGYSRAALERRIVDAVRIARRQVRRWGSGPIAVFPALQRIVTEQLGTIVAGTSTRGEVDDLILFFRTLLQVRVTRQRPALLLRTRRLRRARARVLGLCERVAMTHRQRRPPAHPDLIDALLELHDRDPQFFPRVDHPGAMLGPFVAGLDTVSGMCAFMLYDLLRNPEVMRRATEEADALFDGGPVTPERFRALDVIHRATLETLRLHPLSPGQLRHAINPFELEGHEIPAGERVLAAGTVTHFLPEFFPHPGRYDIGRYAADRNEHRQPGVFNPFGLGAHRCLGAAFASSQAAITLATVLHAASVRLDPPGYRLRIRQTPTARPDNGFRIRAAARRGA